ncbi:site-specific integrase [Pseudonocardia sp. RS11V-5]|uniref:tyrosine-type recombinase/integrase n=1 Tax=Pseudonocardia terrae TaxID=2905831 RepID=UPI001E635C6D|nr:tyrosine-type recombinase/integrase [Pseudonocardia terrae]MCE3552827.1 site-specific integrase [Pseudonocardia terrae]
MTRATGGKRRARGGIDTLPSGALRVRVYAGIDPVTKRRHYLTEIVPRGPRADREAEAALNRLLAEVDERRNPRTGATIDQLLEKYMAQFDGAPNTFELYTGHIKNHISPLLGSTKVGYLDPEMLDALYAELRRCRLHCKRQRGLIDHRTAREHTCDERCKPHRCKPLARSTVRQIHFILSGAFRKAKRWRWVAVNPCEMAEPPPASAPNPQPPTAAESAAIVSAAWEDPEWGIFVWVAMTTGARRGELCAIRWSAVNLEEGRESIWLRHAVRKEGDVLAEAELKTHQQRRIALDAETAMLLRELRDRRQQQARSLGFELPRDAFVFSHDPDGSTHLRPDGVTQRYERLVKRLGIHTTIHKLRHYSATELILAGVDVKTVAGRLGHGGGGTTTLKTYTAWVAEADQRAAGGFAARMPKRPVELSEAERIMSRPRFPYERVAADVVSQILRGELLLDQSPALDAMMIRHRVSLATAKRGAVLARASAPNIIAARREGQDDLEAG